MAKIQKISRTFLPEILAPGTGLSPATNKSILPTNNIVQIQDIMNGTPYRIPGAGGDWSSGQDTEKNYHEYGNDYKRQERDLDIIKNIYNSPKHEEEWVMKIDGGKKIFNSLESLLAYKQKMQEKGVKVKWITRTKTAQADHSTGSTPEKVSVAMGSTFMVECISAYENTMEIGECFCIAPNYFITCAHVIKNYNKNTEKVLDLSSIVNRIKVEIINDNTRVKAEVVAIDAPQDMAILRAEIDCVPLVLDSNNLVGEEVFAIGSPHGFENNVSFGNIGSLNRKIYTHQGAPDYMFLDLSVFSGNSGGPAIKESTGHVVAMITAIISKQSEYGLNAGLASNYIEEFCKKNNVPIKSI